MRLLIIVSIKNGTELHWFRNDKNVKQHKKNLAGLIIDNRAVISFNVSISEYILYKLGLKSIDEFDNYSDAFERLERRISLSAKEQEYACSCEG